MIPYAADEETTVNRSTMDVGGDQHVDSFGPQSFWEMPPAEAAPHTAATTEPTVPAPQRSPPRFSPQKSLDEVPALLVDVIIAVGRSHVLFVYGVWCRSARHCGFETCVNSRRQRCNACVLI